MVSFAVPVHVSVLYWAWLRTPESHVTTMESVHSPNSTISSIMENREISSSSPPETISSLLQVYMEVVLTKVDEPLVAQLPESPENKLLEKLLDQFPQVPEEETVLDIVRSVIALSSLNSESSNGTQYQGGIAFKGRENEGGQCGTTS